MFTINDGSFIYSKDTCMEALEKCGFDIEEVVSYFSREDEYETRINELESELSNEEFRTDDIWMTLNETCLFLEDLKDNLRKGRPTKEKLATSIQDFLNDMRWL